MMLTLPATGLANNGRVAVAEPIGEVTIDGDLGEWGTDRAWSPIATTGDSSSADSAIAEFVAAYSSESQTLYVATRVEDASHVVGEDLSWFARDEHVLYVDREHRQGGSGAVSYAASGKARDLGAPPVAWDPANGGGSWNGVEVAVVRVGSTTIYEWAVALPGFVEPGRSIGLDHLVLDADEGEPPTLFAWGEGFGKASNPYRMGDLLFLDEGEKLGEIRGSIGWAGGVDEPLPTHIRLSASGKEDRWVQVALDGEGRFRTSLPAGEYGVSAAFSLTEPFRVDYGNLPRRVDLGEAGRIRVEAESTVTAEPIELRSFDRPDFLFRDEPLLPTFEPADRVAVDAFVEAFRRYYDIPGVSLALIHQGEVVYSRAFGVKSRLTGERVTDQTLFEGASLTKAVFAFAVLRLVEQGRLDLDQPLHELLAFPNIAADSRSRDLTARIVLSHRSGLPNWAWGGPGTWQDGGELELLFAPGTRYAYSGEAFNYLGRVLEAVTGEDLATLMDREVSRPMGMSRTHYALTEEQAEQAAIGHFNYFPVLRNRATEVSPASSIHSEARDFSLFLLGLIDGKGLSPESYRSMFEPVVPIPADWQVYRGGWKQSMGLGVFLRESPYGLWVEHGGNNDDFDSKFGVAPEAGFGYVVFTNSNVGDELIRALEIFLLGAQS